MEVSTVNPAAGAQSQDSGQQHAGGDINLQSQLQKAQMIKTSTNNDNNDNGNYVDDVASGATATNNSVAKNNSSLPATYNGDAHVNMEITNSGPNQLDSNTNNNIDANSSIPDNLIELDPIQLQADIDSFLKKLVESVVDKFKQEEKEASKQQQQQQLIYNSIASTATTTITTTTTTNATTPLDSTSPTPIHQTDAAVQSHQEQSNQVEQPIVESVYNDAVVDEHDHPDMSPDEVTSDLVIDAGDLQEETPVAPEQTANSTDGDDDNDNTNDTQQQPSNVEPIGGGVELVVFTEVTTTITATATAAATATPAIVSQPDENQLDGVVCEASKSAIVDHTDQELDELKDDEEKAKEMVTLRNLEISPPPLSASAAATADADTSITMETIDTIDRSESTNSQERSAEKRKRTTSTSTTDQNESVESSEGGRSKRRRTQTKLFQVGETQSQSHDDSTTSVASSRSKVSTKASSRSSRKKSTNSSTASESANISANDSITHQLNTPANDLQDVIFYEKNDYLAIRNEENTFYLCQLTENVRSKRPTIRVKWLDTSNDGKTYFLTSHYDMVPQKSIIMVVGLDKLKSEKKGEQLFSLADHDKDQIMERLKRSLSFSGNS